MKNSQFPAVRNPRVGAPDRVSPLESVLDSELLSRIEKLLAHASWCATRGGMSKMGSLSSG